MYNQELEYIHCNPTTTRFVTEPCHCLHSSAKIIKQVRMAFDLNYFSNKRTEDGVLRLVPDLGKLQVAGGTPATETLSKVGVPTDLSFLRL